VPCRRRTVEQDAAPPLGIDIFQVRVFEVVVDPLQREIQDFDVARNVGRNRRDQTRRRLACAFEVGVAGLVDYINKNSTETQQ